MLTVIEAPEFTEWIKNLTDEIAKGSISARILSARHGNLGKTKRLLGTEGICEMKFYIGPVIVFTTATLVM